MNRFHRSMSGAFWPPPRVRSGGLAAGLLAFLVMTALGSETLAGAARLPDKPNVLLIVADDLGYGDLGCFGCKDIRTPHVDSLAAQGVRLTEFYASAPVCTPTRASLITGRYPQHFGFEWVILAREKDRGLPATGASLPELLRQRGYATALYGKWHLGFRRRFAPNAHGFDNFFGFLGSDLDYFAHTDEYGEPGLFANSQLVGERGYLTDLITQHAVAFLKQPRTRPFFLEVAYNAPHWPFQRPDRPDDVRTPRTYGPEFGRRSD